MKFLAFFVLCFSMRAFAAQSCTNAAVVSNGYKSAFVTEVDRCIFQGAALESCSTVCSNIGGSCSVSGIQRIGSDGTVNDANCKAVADAIEGGDNTITQIPFGVGLGCYFSGSNNNVDSGAATNCDAIASNIQRYCACTNFGTINPGSGGQDPHFHGLNGENLDIIQDSFADNERFNVFCDENIVVNALFSPNAEGLLFMTEFSGKFYENEFSLQLGKKPQLYGEFFIEDAQNRTRFVLKNGNIESDGSQMIAKFEDLQVNINTASDVYGNIYFDVDIFPRGSGPVHRPASGIIGRSFEREHSAEEFEQYYQFKLSAKDDKHTSCPGDDGRFGQ